MTPSPEFVASSIAFFAFSIPLIAALWKVFSSLTSMREGLEKQIEQLRDELVDLRHQHELKAQQLEYLSDKLILSVNGVTEVAEHIRTRTRKESDRFVWRLDQVERFLAKTTSYEPRSGSV